jgi:spermidine synthase
MGVGAVLVKPLSRRSAWGSLFGVELLLSTAGSAAVILIQFAHSAHLFLSPASGGRSIVLFFGVSVVMTLIVGLLSGIELPLLIRVGKEIVGDGTITNRVLGWDYIGALAAGVTFPVVLVPLLSLPVIGFATALVNLSVALYVLVRFIQRDTWMVERAVATTALALVLLGGISNGSDIQQYFLKRYYFHLQAAERKTLLGGLGDLHPVTLTHSPYQKIDLVHAPSGYPTDMLLESYSEKWRDYPDFPRQRFLFLNGDFQVSSSHEESYHEWFAHVPIILAGEAPERVLVMGAGDGLLMRELVKYDGIRSIKHVDLDRTSERFDAIYLDFPFAKDYNVAKLYSREFFHFVREHLTEGGFAVLDAPGSKFLGLVSGDGSMTLVPGGEWEIYYNTLRAAGFTAIVPYRSSLESDNPAAFAFLDGWEGTPDFLDPETGRAQPELRADWIRQAVELHPRYFREGFISMWRGDAPTPAYRDPGVELSMLNERRFGISFPGPFPPLEEANDRWVNSIMRPTLPTAGIWNVRRPWN